MSTLSNKQIIEIILKAPSLFLGSNDDNLDLIICFLKGSIQSKIAYSPLNKQVPFYFRGHFQASISAKLGISLHEFYLICMNIENEKQSIY